MPQSVRPALVFATLVYSALLATSCSTTMTGPSAKGPAVNSISPTIGSTLGGTSVTILGGGFATGTTVMIGGTAATDVRITGTTTLTATTPQHAAGIVDVVVSAGGGSTTLTGAFTFVAPTVAPNAPPTIASLVAKGTRANEPAQFADKGETINVTATVTDPETPIANLKFEWTSDSGGTFAGTGAAATWTAPASVPSPVTATLTLTVTETYDTLNSSGLPTKAENKVTKTVAVGLHDSLKEIGSIAELFLTDFSQSSITDVNYILRNFADSCPGKAAEADDVANNRANYQITAYTVGTASVSVSFGGSCSTKNGPRPGDGCAYVPVEWVSTKKSTGQPEHVTGTDQLAAVYQASQNAWKLCSSDFEGISLTTGLPPNPHLWP